MHPLELSYGSTCSRDINTKKLLPDQIYELLQVWYTKGWKIIQQLFSILMAKKNKLTKEQSREHKARREEELARRRAAKNELAELAKKEAQTRKPSKHRPWIKFRL